MTIYIDVNDSKYKKHTIVVKNVRKFTIDYLYKGCYNIWTHSFEDVEQIVTFDNMKAIRIKEEQYEIHNKIR